MLIYVLAKSQDRNLLKVNNYPSLILVAHIQAEKIVGYVLSSNNS